MSANKCSRLKKSKQQIKLDMYKNRLGEQQNEDDIEEERKESLFEKFETEVSEKSQNLVSDATGVQDFQFRNVESIHKDNDKAGHDNEITEESANMSALEDEKENIFNRDPSKKGQENENLSVYKGISWMFLITIPVILSYLVFNQDRFNKLEAQIMKLEEQHLTNQDVVTELKYQIQTHQQKMIDLEDKIKISKEIINRLEYQDKVYHDRSNEQQKLIQKIISQLPKGCICNTHVRADGFGKCQKTHPHAFSGLPFCYVDLPSGCPDLQLSSIESSMGASAVACGEKNNKLDKYSVKLKNLVKSISPFKLFQ